MYGRWAVGLVLLPIVCTCALACARAQANVRLPSKMRRVAVSVGDVVFLRTTTWRGRVVRIFESERDDFSHVGVIVEVAGDRLRFAHAAPGENGGSGIVRVDDLAALLARDDVVSADIYHARVSEDDAMRAAGIAWGYAKSQTPFDRGFRLDDDHAVYCTELVWLSYRQFGLTVRSRSAILFPSDLLTTGFFVPRDEVGR